WVAEATPTAATYLSVASRTARSAAGLAVMRVGLILAAYQAIGKGYSFVTSARKVFALTCSCAARAASSSRPRWKYRKGIVSNPTSKTVCSECCDSVKKETRVLQTD